MTFDDPTKQEIWATVRAMNDAWTKGSPDDLANFFHRTMVAVTPVDRLRRVGAKACIEGWKGFCEAAQIHRFDEIDPLIEVFGDAAVVSYYYDMSFDMGGQTIDTAGRDLFFFIKEAGRWWAVADQFSPYPLA
jgi:ketosteroid isomerase-like protein